MVMSKRGKEDNKDSGSYWMLCQKQLVKCECTDSVGESMNGSNILEEQLGGNKGQTTTTTFQNCKYKRIDIECEKRVFVIYLYLLLIYKYNQETT